MARLGIQDILALADYWVTTFIDGHQEVSYVDSKDGRRHTWIVPRGLVVPPSRMTIARSESRRFKDYLDRTIAHSAKRKNAEDGDVLLEMARRDTSQAEARRIVRWKRNVRAQWRELLAEFRDRDWAQKPLSDATIDAATLARRNEAHQTSDVLSSLRGAISR
jgi:hypothetical protein